MPPLTQRDAFFSRLYELAKADKRITLLSIDMGAPALDDWKINLPAQCINVGIAEQNAIGLAAGMAAEGRKVFVYSIIPFLTLRCLEQIRNDLAFPARPVTLVGVGAGLSYASAGPTHWGTDDLAVMRALPIQIDTVSDWVMARWLAGVSVGMAGPNYIRLDRDAYDAVYRPEDTFEAGFSLRRPFGDALILTFGAMVPVALDISERLRAEDFVVGVADCYRLPLPPELLAVLRKTRRIFTLEEHGLAGGLGSAVLEILADADLAVSAKRFGMYMAFQLATNGTREQIRARHGLTVDQLTQAIHRELHYPLRVGDA